MHCLHSQLALLVRPAKMLPAMTAHVEVANVSLKGQCRLDLTLAPDKAPGISGAMVSFSQAPAIDFDFVPFGLPIGELPYVLEMLKVGVVHLHFPSTRHYFLP